MYCSPPEKKRGRKQIRVQWGGTSDVATEMKDKI